MNYPKAFQRNDLRLLLCLMIIVIPPTCVHAKTKQSIREEGMDPIVSTSVVRQHQWLLSNQITRVELPNRDAKKVETFKTMFLLRLYMIFQRMYMEHVPSVASDWSQIANDYTALANISKEFAVLSHDEIISSDFFTMQGYFFAEVAALSREIGSALQQRLLPQEYSARLYRKLILQEGGRLIYPEEYQKLLGPWTNRFNTALNNLYRTLNGAAENWRQEYKFDADAVLSGTGTLPFRLPFVEFDDDSGVEYLYDAFIKDAGLSIDLESYYRGTFSNIFRRIWNESFFKMEEISLLWMNLISLRVPVSKVVRVFVYLGFNCANKLRKEFRAAHYHRANRLHNVILGYLAEGNKVLYYLRQLAENKKSNLLYNRQKYEVYINGLIEEANTYLNQRSRLENYPKRWAEITNDLAKSSESGESDLITSESEINIIVNAVIRGKSFEVVAREYAKDKALDAIDPCGRLYDLIKASVRSSFSASDPLAEKVEPTPEAKQKEASVYDFTVTTGGSTNVAIRKGNNVSIAATGSIKLGPFAGNSTPDGIPGYEMFSYFPNVPHGSLLYRLKGSSDTWFLCGRQCSFTAGGNGVVELLVNDKDYQNNAGEYNVRITVH